MINIKENRLRDALQVVLGDKGIYTERFERELVSQIKAFAIRVVVWRGEQLNDIDENDFKGWLQIRFRCNDGNYTDLVSDKPYTTKEIIQKYNREVLNI